MDESFILFCRHADAYAMDFWKEWMNESEEQKRLALEAISLFQSMTTEEEQIKPDQVDAALNALVLAIKRDDPENKNPNQQVVN